MSLLEPSQAYKPFRYPWAHEMFMQQNRMHWMAEEVPMADDVHDWKHTLTTSEKNVCTQIFRFFTQADIDVNDCYMTKYSNIFKPNEVRMMLSAFAAMEATHIHAYSFLVDTLGMPDGIYTEFLRYKAMKDKHDFLGRFSHTTNEGIATILAVYGAFIEGVQLFASFAILMNFQRFGKMKGMGQIVTWSARDETLHTNSIIMLFKTFVSENPEVWTISLKDEIYKICDTVVMLEDAFIDLVFEISESIDGLSATEIKRYIRYIADRRLEQLGLKSKYLIKSNPLPWMDFILNGVEHANFFENRSTEYARAASTGTWEEAFTIHDKQTDYLFPIDQLI